MTRAFVGCRPAYFYPRPPRGGRRHNTAPARTAGCISIHALREEGDSVSLAVFVQCCLFLSTPSARRATCARRCKTQRRSQFLSTPSARRATWACGTRATKPKYFYPRPPRGGRLFLIHVKTPYLLFLSTPSARRATTILILYTDRCCISIHALREEGDNHPRRAGAKAPYFYPRPPRGGRRSHREGGAGDPGFLSTPSARRATPDFCISFIHGLFLSTPSARRATHNTAPARTAGCISIHALREEGDQEIQGTKRGQENFYPRPPRGGRRLPSSVRASS